jgi:hypothetical protein
LYEKSPEYYNSLLAPMRIKAMNKDIKLVTIVCDNVRRVMSRYLHIKQILPEKLAFLGTDSAQFNEHIRTHIGNFQDFLDNLRNVEGNGTTAGLVRNVKNIFLLTPKNNLKQSNYY